MQAMNFTTLVLYIGTFVFAMSGALKARAHAMDLFGGLVLAFVTAYGGGTIRDLIIGLRPISWINDSVALLLVVGATGIVFLFRRSIHKFNFSIFLTDAVGLAMFTVVGIDLSLTHQINQVYCVVLGVISATFGGLLADIISNQVPSLLRRGELYATASAIGGAVYLFCDWLGIEQELRSGICVAVVVAIRFISRKKQISLPDI